MSKVIIPVVFLLVAVGLFFTYLRPAYDTLVALQRQEGRIDSALTDSRTLVTRTQELVTKYQDFSKADVARLQAILPDTIDPVRLIIDINALAVRSGVKMLSFGLPNVEPAKTPDPIFDENGVQIPVVKTIGVDRAKFQVECEGTYGQVKQFLASIETSLTLLDVTSLRIDQHAEANKDDVLQLRHTLMFETYALN
jgi:Tfp pilus assembly protein PilO